jgi:amino acid transporter
MTKVAGEISSKNPSTLRRGFLWAVAVVGILYMALNTVFVSGQGVSDKCPEE